ncbi:MAG: hypothetical protein HUJ25_06305 [Crocinitomicaceae bacterium]|nr:hypothetical protein [Crocinitomicaceae bacterium]
MRYLLFIGLLFTTCFNLSYAQVTRGDLENMMDELDTNPENIKEMFIGNTSTYSKEQAIAYSYKKYSADRGNTLSLTDSGIKILYAPDGKPTSVYFIPYKKIATVELGKTWISIYLDR